MTFTTRCLICADGIGIFDYHTSSRLVTRDRSLIQPFVTPINRWGNSQRSTPMPVKMLTDPFLKNEKPQAERVEYADQKIGGLYFIVQPSGHKS